MSVTTELWAQYQMLSELFCADDLTSFLLLNPLLTSVNVAGLRYNNHDVDYKSLSSDWLLLGVRPSTPIV